MRYLLFIKCFFFLLFSNSSQAAEKVYFQLDDRNWKIGFEEFAQEQTNVEMVLTDENVLNWTELFTIQSFQNLKASAEEFANTLEKTFQEKKESSPQNISFKWIEKGPLFILENNFEGENTKENEFNIGRVLKSDDTIYYLLYSAKDEDLFNETKSKWAERLKHAYIAESPKESQKGHWFSYETKNVYEGSNKLPYQPEMAIVTNKEAGFQITLPTDWLMNKEDVKADKKDSTDTIALLFLRADQKLFGGVAFFENQDKKNINQSEQYFESYKSQSEKAKLIGNGEIETKSHDHGKFIIIQDGTEIAKIAFFDKNGRYYRVEVWGEKGEFENNIDMIDKIITSFQLI